MVTDRRESFYEAKCAELCARYSGFEESSASVLRNLVHTYDVISTWGQKCLNDYGLAKSSFNILMILRHGPSEGMQLHDLGELLLMSRANVTGLIDHLEQKGLVKRIVDANDRRARFARITRKGEALLDEAGPRYFVRIAQLLENFTPEERTTFVRLLKKLRRETLAEDEETTVTADQQPGTQTFFES